MILFRKHASNTNKILTLILCFTQIAKVPCIIFAPSTPKIRYIQYYTHTNNPFNFCNTTAWSSAGAVVLSLASPTLTDT